ncbi:MAG: hypothetical protein KAR20_04535, partial [Candidatus Heimdallarchaeota archaeon]|nr:hypothetical protein [Candidatus Heimdallarchaeota archaeon]
DSKQVSVYSPERIEEEFKYAFRQAKDYIASKIIYNTDKYKTGDYDMQNPEDKYHDVRHFGKKSYGDISTKAKHEQWKKSAEESVRGW